MISLVIGDKDASELASTIKWSGSYSQCARTLSVTLAASPYDESIPVIDASPGTPVTFAMDGQVLFSGFVAKRSRSTGASTLSVTAYDRGFYLNRCEIVRQYKDTTPEAIAADLCGEFGISVGKLVSTGYTMSRNFIGVTVYKAIMTAYTLASGSTGKKYQARFDGENFTVVEVGANETTLVIKGGSNLQDASYTDSIEQTYTEAVIYSKDAEEVATVENGLSSTYGVIRKVIQQAEGQEQEARDKAAETLDENGLSQTATVECLGNVQNISGNTVVVQEPYTGLCGLFWISADTHEWKNGVYYNKLTLSFREMMDEETAGSLPNGDGSATSSKTKSSGASGGAAKKAEADSTAGTSLSQKKWESLIDG